MVDGFRDVELVDAANHLVDGPEAELSHQLAHIFSDKPEEVLDELRLPGKAPAQLGILSRYAYGARVEVTDAHHDASHHDEWCSREPELFGTEQRADDDIAAGLHLSVDLH